MNIKKTIALIFIVLSLTAVLAACGDSHAADSSAESAESIESSDTALTDNEHSNSENSEEEESKNIVIDSKTILGAPINSEVFKDNELTLVNIFATWCGPCVGEIPDLQKISAADNGFGVIGMVADTFDSKTGEISQEAVETAKEIAEKTGAEYPFIIPDSFFMENTLNNAAALFPISFIADKDGLIVQGPIGGAHSEEEWLQILNDALESLNK
ncbi:MAG: TlpA family protein disulfide reductase [Candidatus Limivicinus sp.]|jgi:thiol-disulfide isomerase/thioredoxin